MLPEQRILVDLLNGRFEEIVLRGLTPENWSSLVSQAGRHRIAPLLYHKIKAAGVSALFPENVVKKLRAIYLATSGRNTVFFHQLSALLACLNDRGIPVVLLKGAHLAEFVYGDVGLRPMSDIDILIKEEHLSRVVQIAADSGFRFFFDKNPEKENTRKSLDYGILNEFKHFNALIHPETKCMLEIHCFIASKDSPFEIPAADLWGNAQPAMLNERSVLLLSPEDLIIHLCLHAAYDHLFDFGLSALYDISATINHYGKNLNWEKIFHRSGQWRTRQCLQLSLYFTKKWLGAEIPDAVFENFRTDQMVDIAEERIFKLSATVPLHPHYLQWRNLNGWREKFRYIGKVLLPSREFMASRYLKPKYSKRLFGTYVFRFFQGVTGVFYLAKTVVSDSHYGSRLRQGDNDFHLREWLIRS